MVSDSIGDKLASLVRLAKRPGSPAEGEVARQMAIRLSLKYQIPCEFTAHQFPSSKPRPKAEAPPPPPPDPNAEAARRNMYCWQWVHRLAEIGWMLHGLGETRVGFQLRFRNPEWNSEIRVTQRRMGDGTIFDAEHIMRPDADQYGRDWSYTTWMGVTLEDTLQHLSHTTAR